LISFAVAARAVWRGRLRIITSINTVKVILIVNFVFILTPPVLEKLTAFHIISKG